ncbi:MAG: sulfotransferase [Actinomycetota bacterium]|nr:sulfotransferase [Actinomycetota bacterium]MDQ2980989.1 sulfotransferase [Actinomycetota bacterium]
MSERGSVNPYAFIVGSARSGTTLLRRIVDAHPLMAISKETHWVPQFYKERRGLTEEGFVTTQLVSELAAYWRFPRFRIREDELAKLVEGNGPVSYADFVSGFYDLIGRARKKPFVVDKTGSYSREIPLLHGLWPQTRFVHLIRDGRDVALSMLSWDTQVGARRFSTWHEDPVTTTGLWWTRNAQLGREGGSALPKTLYHELRYENLVAGPETECKALCAFLGVPYDEGMLRFHEGRTRSEPSLAAKQAWLPITPNLRNWREQMPPEDVERFEAAAGDLLDELGYERAFPEPREEFSTRADELRGRVAAELRAQRQPIPVGW